MGKRKFHGKADNTRCIADASGDNQPESGRGSAVNQSRHTKDDHPPHQEVDRYGNNIGAGRLGKHQRLKKGACNYKAPLGDAEAESEGPSDYGKADRCIGSGNCDIYHNMVDPVHD